jgi:DNA modification methylase
MNLKTVTIADLKPHPQNPNTHPAKQIDALGDSLNEFDQVKNVVIWRGLMLAGHAVREAAIKSGRLTLEAVDVSHWDEDKATAFMLADIRLPDMGIYDEAAMAEALRHIDEPLDIPGFDEDFLAEMGLETEGGGQGGGGEEGPIEPGAAEKAQEVWGTELGQLWAVGEHRLICGDCTDRETVERLMGKNDIDLVLTDPPYSVNYGQKNRALNSIGPSNRIKSDIKNDTLSTEDTAELIWGPAFRNAYNKSRNGTVFYCFSPQGGDQMMMMMMMMIKAEWNKRLHQLIWRKNSPTFSMGRLDYQYQHEPILYTWRGTNHGYYGEVGRSVIDCDRPNVSKFHPTMKPVLLVSKLIENSSRLNELVYDPFFGSGTTLVAAHQLNRRCFGIEIDPGYTAICLQRANDVGISPIELIK